MFRTAALYTLLGPLVGGLAVLLGFSLSTGFISIDTSTDARKLLGLVAVMFIAYVPGTVPALLTGLYAGWAKRRARKLNLWLYFGIGVVFTVACLLPMDLLPQAWFLLFSAPASAAALYYLVYRGRLPTLTLSFLYMVLGPLVIGLFLIGCWSFWPDTAMTQEIAGIIQTGHGEEAGQINLLFTAYPGGLLPMLLTGLYTGWAMQTRGKPNMLLYFLVAPVVATACFLLDAMPFVSMSTLLLFLYGLLAATALSYITLYQLCRACSSQPVTQGT